MSFERRFIPRVSEQKLISALVCLAFQYAANLWVWSTPRAGYPGNPKNPNYNAAKKEEEVPKGRVVATFRNKGDDSSFREAKLFFHDGQKASLWGNLGHGDPSLSVNTYESHVWKIMVDGEERRSWTIGSDDPPTLEFDI